MLAVVFPQSGSFELREVPEPEIKPGQVLVRVRSTTICATDFKVFEGVYPGVTYPHIPGHEWGGEVVQTGVGVTGLNPSDKVGIEVHVGCGVCLRCSEGMYNLCENYGRADKGHAHIGFTVPGGLAEYCVVPAQAVHPLPEGLGFDHGAFTDTVGIVLWAFERAGGVWAGERVVVVGPGALGLLAVQIARAGGAREVIAVGAANDADRLKLARSMGADHTLNIDQVGDPTQVLRDMTDGKGADLVIEFAGTSQAANLSIKIARRGGRIVLGGATSPGRKLEIDLSTIVRGHLNIFGSVANPRGISMRANELMQKNLVDVGPLITHHLSLSEFGQAWKLFRERREGAIRIMMHP